MMSATRSMARLGQPHHTLGPFPTHTFTSIHPHLLHRRKQTEEWDQMDLLLLAGFQPYEKSERKKKEMVRRKKNRSMASFFNAPHIAIYKGKASCKHIKPPLGHSSLLQCPFYRVDNNSGVDRHFKVQSAMHMHPSAALSKSDIFVLRAHAWSNNHDHPPPAHLQQGTRCFGGDCWKSLTIYIH